MSGAIRTVEEAGACGLSGAEASRMAIANGNQDYWHPFSWRSDTNPHHAMPDTNYQPIIDRGLQQAVAEPDWIRALAILGAGLHTVQDQWAHARRNPPGTIRQHDYPTGGIHPDNRWQNPYEWSRAREDTRYYIRDFMKGRGLKPSC